MDRQTINTYNQTAKEYDDETIDFWDQFPRTFLDIFIKLSDKSILDIGSGPCRDGVLLQRKGKDVTCLDASEEMVKISSGRGLPSVVGDFNHLPFKDGGFDGIWSYTALLHVPKVSVGVPMEEIHRVLKPSGIFALGLIEGDTEGYRESSGVNMPRWFSFYKKDEAEVLCARHGFELIHFEIFKPRSRNYLNFIFRKT